MAHPEVIEGTQYLSYWGTSLASYIASLIECKRLDARLRQSTHRLELAATALNALIYDWDLSTGQMRRTQGLINLCGYTLDEADPTMDWWTQRMHAEDWQRLAPFFQGQFPEQDEFELEYRIRHKEQRDVAVGDRGVIVRDPQGETSTSGGSCFRAQEGSSARGPGASPARPVCTPGIRTTQRCHFPNGCHGDMGLS